MEDEFDINMFQMRDDGMHVPSNTTFEESVTFLGPVYGLEEIVAGYTGSQGDTGFVGSHGYTGSQGDIGYTGSQGDIGYTGSQGDIGFTGSQGDIGYTGSAGGFTDDSDAQVSSLGVGVVPDGNVGSIRATGYIVSHNNIHAEGHVRSNGPSSFGAHYTSLAVNQTTATLRYLLLARKGDAQYGVNGTITGRRDGSSGAGQNSASVYIYIVANGSGGSFAHWDIVRQGPASRVVELTYGGNVWYALDAVNTGSTAPFQNANFVGYTTNHSDQWTWVAAGDVSGVTTIVTDQTTIFGNIVSITSSGLGAASSTTASAANIHQASSGSVFLRSTSAAQYKTDVVDIPLPECIRIVRELRPISYRSTASADNPKQRYFGLIAEEVADVSPLLVHWIKNEDGDMVPDGVMYDRIAAIQNKVIDSILDRLDALEAI